MFEASHKPVDSRNTLTGFLLTVACVFIPSALIFFRPLSNLSLSLAAAASAVCLIAAWMSGKRNAGRRVAPVAIITTRGK